MIKPYQFIGILGIATTVIGLFAIVFNDKVVGAGLVTGGVGDIGLSVMLAQQTQTSGT